MNILNKIRVVLFLTTILFTFIGFILLLAVGMMYAFFPEFQQILGEDGMVLRDGCLAIGTVLNFIGLTGFTGTLSKSDTNLMLFLFVLCLAVVALCVLFYYILAMNKHVGEFFENRLKFMVKSYNNNTIAVTLLDKIQSYFKCCGYTEFHREWESVFQNEKQVPISCCRVKKDLPENETMPFECSVYQFDGIWFSKLYNEPCMTAMNGILRWGFIISLGVVTGWISLILIVIGIVLIAVKEIREMRRVRIKFQKLQDEMDLELETTRAYATALNNQ